MIIYEVWGGGFDDAPGHCRFFSTKKEAIDAAKANGAELVQKLQIPDNFNRALACDLANRENFVIGWETIWGEHPGDPLGDPDG